MFPSNDHRHRHRVAGIAGTVAVQIVLGALFLWGLTVRGERAPSTDPLASVTIVDLPPPTPAPAPVSAATAAPASSGVEGTAALVEAPAALTIFNPAPAAPRADDGADASDGAGRLGTGEGSGGSGTGDGGGVATPARRIAGALRDSDYPRGAERAGLAGTVGIRFRVRRDGRVDQCVVMQSSGHDLLDELTCELFTQRYRFEPALAADGRPVDSILRTNFTWGTRRR